MLTYHLATAALLLLLGQDADSASTPKQKLDFMREMNSNDNKAARRKLSPKDRKEFHEALYGDSERSSNLRKKLIEKSTVVTPPGGDRKLENNNNNNGNNGNGNNNNNANGAVTGAWNNAFGFDPTQFSLSYHRCASVRQYDDEVAALADTESVFTTKQFAVFRFCPEKTCMGINEEEFECDEDTYGYQYCAKMRQQQQNGQGQGYQGQSYQQSYNGQGQQASSSYGGMFDYLKEDQKIFGARGRGCASNYGEYMIELEDYLSLMLEYQEERVQTYCEYCEQCMFDVYEQWLENGGQRRELVTFEDFKNSEDHQRDLRNDDEVDANTYKVCPEYDTCNVYYDMCKGGGADDHLTEYFECTQVETDAGHVAYVGPHCSSDGFSVTLGVYSDEYCNEYIGDGVNIANFIGEELDLEEDALKPWYNSANGALEVLEYANEDNVCIPCRKADLPYEDSDYVANDDDTDDYTENINYGETEVNEICENLYEVSARCDKHYRIYTTKSSQAKFAMTGAQEDLSCAFIDSVAMGNYNEMGFINFDEGGDATTGQRGVQRGGGFLETNLYAQQYGHYVTEVNPLQIFGLVASLLACAILVSWSVKLQKSLHKSDGRAWRPRARFARPASNLAHEDSGIGMARQDSGVGMARSHDEYEFR